MGGEARRKAGFSRTLSVDSFKSVRKKPPDNLPVEKEKKTFEIKTITYKTFPKSYKEVPEDIWHWVPLPPDDENTSIVSNKNDLYMKTLTFQEIEDLDTILLNKMR